MCELQLIIYGSADINQPLFSGCHACAKLNSNVVFLFSLSLKYNKQQNVVTTQLLLTCDVKCSENNTLVPEYTVKSGVGMAPDNDDMLIIAPFLRSSI